MTWWTGGAYGKHCRDLVGTPSTQWFLAEGTTVLGFQPFYCCRNPQGYADDRDGFFSFLLRPARRSSHLRPGPRSRTTIYVKRHPALRVDRRVGRHHGVPAEIVVRARADVSARRGEQSFALGHAASGIAGGDQLVSCEGATGRVRSIPTC